MSANLRAFLYVIRWCEGTAGEDGYRMHFGGELFDSFADHPRRAITRKHAGKPITSTAAGAYQFLARTWDECQRALKLPDFSPASQDNAAVFLIKRRGALGDVEAGRIEVAIRKCAREWASLPGSPYGQPTKPLAECLAVYHRAGGLFFTAPLSEVQLMPIAPFIAAALPALIEAAPDLIRILGDGKQSKQNAKAAEKVAEIVKVVTAQPTLEQAVADVQTQPEFRDAFREAVREQWYELTETGGGGLDGARAFNAKVAESSTPFWKMPAFWISFALLAPFYAVLGDVLFAHPDAYSESLRTQIVTAVIGLSLSVGAFWLGSSMSSRGKDEALAKAVK